MATAKEFFFYLWECFVEGVKGLFEAFGYWEFGVAIVAAFAVVFFGGKKWSFIGDHQARLMKIKSLIFVTCVFTVFCFGAFSKHKDAQAKIAALTQKQQHGLMAEDITQAKTLLAGTGGYLRIIVQ